VKPVTEAIDKAREFSPEIADWIDDARKRGVSEADIFETLSAATALARLERKVGAKT